MAHPLHTFAHCPRCGSERFDASSEKSKRCRQCGFELFMNPSAAVAAFISDTRGRLLFTVRNRQPALGTLDLPGGFTDIGETAEEAIRREVLEETGLCVADARYLFSLPNSYLYSGLAVPTMDLFFECRVDDFAPLHAADDAAECRLLAPADVRASDIGLDSVRRAFLLKFGQEGKGTESRQGPSDKEK